MIGSAKENRTAIIEKSPTKIDLFETQEDQILCSNHFQSKAFENDELNIKNLAESDSRYRYDRLTELLSDTGGVDILRAAAILRNQRGVGDADLGMGNQKSINQLNAHHAIIFKPQELKVWVSTPPFQLGQFVAYDLKKIFSEYPDLQEKIEIRNVAESIPADPFLYTPEFKEYMEFRQLKFDIKDCLALEEECELSDAFLKESLALNPEYWYGYELVGDYFRIKEDNKIAREYYETALSKVVPTLGEENRIREKMASLTE